MNFRRRYRLYKVRIDQRLARMLSRRAPRSLYEPIRYILRTGGKRVRPVLTLLACESVGGRVSQALDAAVAIEILHGFTLVHDDIMDNADTRRGRQTIHRRWDHNTAILAGDEMIALAYRSLLNTGRRRVAELLDTFTRAFNDVCEGQGLDAELALRRGVDLRAYMRMIRKKTAAMLAAATTLGGIAGGGSGREVAALRRYGEYLGLAFQMQDDLLDLVAETRSFGKKVGGDLKEGKKTYLMIKGLESTRGGDHALLEKVISRRETTKREIDRLKTILDRNGVLADARSAVTRSTRFAQRELDAIRRSKSRDMLAWFADELLERNF